VVNIIEEKIAAVQEPVPTPARPKPPKLKGTGKLTMPLDPILSQARNELSGSNISAALENYSRLIKKGRFLDEVIFDLRDALYRFPVDVDIWQLLGDAYMRSNRLQDALDSYTKAEELLR
jgi:tetratricopeptide (TPR) repeat protein